MSIKYNNGKIYKIVNNRNDILYIGSTANTLCKRMDQHKKASLCRDSMFYQAVDEPICVGEE